LEPGYVDYKIERKQVVPVTGPIVNTIDTQLNKLRSQIISLNQEGNLHGLFSYFILSDVSDFPLNWDVLYKNNKWLKNTFQESNVYHVAALGYSLELHPNTNHDEQDVFVQAITKLKNRKLFNGSHTTFPYNPLVFLGLSLGAKSLPSTERQVNIDWLLSVLRERKEKGKITSLHGLFYSCIEALLTDQPTVVSVAKFNSIETLSFLLFGYKKGYFRLDYQNTDIASIRKNILNLLIRTEISSIPPENAALIWYGANESVFGGISRLIVSPGHLSFLLSKFQAAMKRWRFDSDDLRSPIRWPIHSEREVQDIIWLMLRPYFDDLIDEENLPQFGHSSYKPDFALPSLNVLLEVKYTRSASDFKKTEKQIMEDSVGYLANTSKYNKIIVFIYDHSSSVQEHDQTQRALKQIDCIEDVIIVSRPSQLPI